MQRFLVLKRLSVVLALLLLAAGCAPSSETVIVTQRPEPLPSTEDQPAPPLTQQPLAEPTWQDTVEAQRFDQGKMWTFGDPPLEYFREAYDFSPSQAWFRKARLGALRFADYCSASFVSAHGLVLTNHHCARESVTQVNRSGEDLLETGFYAETLDAEREVEDLYVDQLVEIEEVTDDLDRLLDDKQWPCKANLLTRAHDMDELVGDIAEQSVYVSVPNPLQEL